MFKYKYPLLSGLSILLGVSLGLISVTSFRFIGNSVGIGEFLLVIWCLVITFKLMVSDTPVIGYAPKIFIPFWISSLFLLLLGSLWSLYLGDWDNRNGPREFVVYFIMSLFTICLSFYKSIFLKYEQVIISYWLVMNFILFLAFLLVLLNISNVWSPIHNYRFIGFTMNPNQLALFILPMPFISFKLIAKLKNLNEILINVILLLAILICGYFTHSEALLLSWAIGFTFMIFIKIYKNLNFSLQKITKKQINILILICFISIYFNFDFLYQFIENIFNQNVQMEGRLSLILNGLEPLRKSFLFGYGAGDYSGDYFPLYNTEAHNLFIDWLGSTGIIGLNILLLLFFIISYVIYRTGDIQIAGFWVALLILTQFHFPARQPIFWFYLVFIFSYLEDKPKEISLFNSN